MSLELLKEFGSQSQIQRENLWADIVDREPANRESIDEDDFGDFEIPDDHTPAEKHDLSDPGDMKGIQPSLGNSGIGELVDLSEGPSRNLGLPSYQGSESSIEPQTPLSLSKRRTDDRSTSLKIPHSEPKGASIALDKASTIEGLDDQDWDNFVGCSIPSAAYDRNGQGHDLGAQKAISSWQSTKHSKPPSNSLEPIEETTASFKKVANAEPTKSSSLARSNHLGSITSNIPPPSILLLLIETMFESLSAETKNIVLIKDASALLSNQSKVDQLRILLSMVRAAARVIRGRKLRWKRDMNLSQSMKIGPAHSSKIGGMKLTGLDRTESLREDRGVEEVFSIWRKHLGRLRAAITQANAEIPGAALVVPDISENMHIRIAKLDEGALTAPKPCLLCGIKRDERLEKVDVDVEDSFGEWWTDYWGHLDCRIFWERHEDSLRQRR